MIDAVLNTTCTVKHRLDDTRNNDNEYQYQSVENVPCTFIKKFGRVAKVADENYINIAVTVLMTREVFENDLIVLEDGYQYRIASGGLNAIGIEPIKDFFTGAIEGYQISLVREREEDEQQTSIIESSNRKGLAT